MGEFLKNLIKYSVLIAVLCTSLALLAKHSLQQSSIFKASFLITNFPTSTHFDYFITGSSRGLTSISSRFLDHELGTNGINLSQDDTGLPNHILMAKHFFESGYRASHCILVVDESHFTYSPPVINDNDYRFGQFLDRKYIYDYFREKETGIRRPFTLGRYFPAYLYGYYNTELFYPAILGLVKPNYRLRFDEKGDYFYPDQTINLADTTTITKRWIKESAITNPLIEEFDSYLKKFGCQLVIYIAPYLDIEIKPLFDLEAPLINHSSLLNERNLFFDPIHVNTHGNAKASKALAEELRLLIQKNPYRVRAIGDPGNHAKKWDPR